MLKKYFQKILIIFATVILIASCEDPAPKDYFKTTVVEALLIVDAPIENIRITKTLPLYEPYEFANSIISDAKVFIYEVGEFNQEFELVFRNSENRNEIGYYFPNKNYTVKRNTTYDLKIILSDGTTVTGTTTTPDSISWVNKIPQFVQYPFDTINRPVNNALFSEWKNENPHNAFYMISYTCLDTFEYGNLFSPPIFELNRRTYPPRRRELSYRERSYNTFGILPRNPLQWHYFKWFGHHSIKVYLPDKNYQNWLLYFFFTGELDEKANSLKGCAGFFGSAFMLESEFILLKNQP